MPASQSAIREAVGGVVGGAVGGAFLVGITAAVLVVVVKRRKKGDKNRAGKGNTDSVYTCTTVAEKGHLPFDLEHF